MKNTHKIIKDVLEKQSLDREEIPLSCLPDPSLIPNLELAAKRIIENLDNGKTMLIVGDYDCDGIMATTTMIDFFRHTKYRDMVDYIVPDRFIDGYGISKNMIDYAIQRGHDFIVTVDNGIGAFEAVEYANEHNIEVIITDHHTPGEKIPNANIIVNLKYELGDFPFMEISGATLAWYLCAQINKDISANIDMKKWLDLIGITVISDVMPLKSLNTSLVRYALNAIKDKKRFLYELIFSFNKREVLTETDIAFAFVPMINAVGRLDNARNAIEILLSKDKSFVRNGYRYLIDTNNQRKNLTQELLNKVTPEADKQVESGCRAIVVRVEDLHEGIVGILAGKLAETYMRPCYVFGWNKEKNIWKGSGRTSGVIQLYDLTREASEYALGFGGHAGAVGVAILDENFDSWKNIIQEKAKLIQEKEFIPVGEVPFEVNLSDINQELMSIIDSYRPYGQEFPMPVFKAEVFVSILESYKEGLHTKCIVIDQEGFSYVAWFFHDKNLSIHNGKTVNILFTPMKSITNKGYVIELHATVNYLNR